MSFLEISGVTKTYPRAAEPCVKDLSLNVEKGTIVAILGESGCGKTTLLKLVAGLERQEQGAILIDGEDMGAKKAEKRPISMVFQKALLFGNMTVEKNINFAPRVNRSMDRAALKKGTEEMLSVVHLDGMGAKRPHELSGGQEQRVSLARALMTKPKLLLLDEPLSALDANLKVAMQDMIREVNAKLGITMLYVTHDQNEAAAVADKIALMRNGRILQFDKPETFYSRPATKYVAEFFGCKNIIPAQKERAIVKCGLGHFELPELSVPDGRVLLCVRPEAIINIGKGALSGTVEKIVPRATDNFCALNCGTGRLEAHIPFGSISKEMRLPSSTGSP